MRAADVPRRERVTFTPDQGELFARAMLGALDVAGHPTDLQYRIIGVVARHVMGADLDPHRIDPLHASEVATLVTDPAMRRRLVQGAVTLELLEDPTRELARHVRAFARALDVAEPMVDAAGRLARGQLALMYADIMRSSYYTEETEHLALHGHLWRLIRSKVAYSNVVASRAIERRWRALADLPPGSLGATVAEFYGTHHFPFPGERRGIGEVGAHHDFVHVLADYPPSPEGEIDVFAFIAASMTDPRGFVQLVMTLGLFQNATIKHVAGKRVVIAREGTLEDDGAAARFGDALDRGSRCEVEALCIDHFAIAAEPLDELREQFSIPPREDETQPGALDAG
jgi:hypothetical protein